MRYWINEIAILLLGAFYVYVVYQGIVNGWPQ